MSLLNGLSEGQVLQRIGRRGANLVVTGESVETGGVMATISDSRGCLKGWKGRLVGEARDGRFGARFTGIPAGGAYRLELRVGRKRLARVESFFVGDVWLLAGQSNMEGCGLIEGAAKSHRLIRAFSMRREWRLAAEPLHMLAESPDGCHAQHQCAAARGEALRRGAVKGSGAGLYFAHDMLRRSGLPQGLICTAHGGTSMAQWDPALKGEGGGSLYGSMLLSVRATGQPVAGMLWYQGESDAGPNSAPLFEGLMKKLVAATRRDLRQPGLPWIMVQISRVYGQRKEEDVRAWNRVQEAQRLLPGKIKNMATVSAIDLPLDDAIHIGVDGHRRLGARLARAAARLVYGDRREKGPPRVKSIAEPCYRNGLGYHMDIAFADVVGGLRANGEALGFSILDKDGDDQCTIYRTTLRGDSVRLHLGGYVPGTGFCVAYGHGVMPVCTITDGRDESPLVFAAMPLNKPAALCPFIRKWKVTSVIPTHVPLARIVAPDVAAHGGVVKIYGTDFIDEHALWEKCGEGHTYFSSAITLSEPMQLDFLMGYDGPFRMWIDGKAFFQDLKGTNPALMDQSHRLVTLRAGTHQLCIAMDTNSGKAYGFFLRMRRADVSLVQIASGEYARPFCQE